MSNDALGEYRTITVLGLQRPHKVTSAPAPPILAVQLGASFSISRMLCTALQSRKEKGVVQWKIAVTTKDILHEHALLLRYSRVRLSYLITARAWLFTAHELRACLFTLFVQLISLCSLVFNRCQAIAIGSTRRSSDRNCALCDPLS